MKISICFCISFFSFFISIAQPPAENLVIITIDGLRWQELFRGADSSILFSQSSSGNQSIAAGIYWSENSEERRRKLFPFVWGYVKNHGQIWGNRDLGSRVSVANTYRLSYAGYHELLTGTLEPAVYNNRPKYYDHENLLKYFSRQPSFKGKVAAFCSWSRFRQIIQPAETGLVLNTAFDWFADVNESPVINAANHVRSFCDTSGAATRPDMLTFTIASEYMRLRKPKVTFIGFGMTDEYAHHGNYNLYLQQANAIDGMIAQLWMMIQQDSFYKNKTSLIITTDHGRGRKAANWNRHGVLVGGSDETWLIHLGSGCTANGEMEGGDDIKAVQLARYAAGLLGIEYRPSHPVADAFRTEQNCRQISRTDVTVR